MGHQIKVPPDMACLPRKPLLAMLVDVLGAGAVKQKHHGMGAGQAPLKSLGTAPPAGGENETLRCYQLGNCRELRSLKPHPLWSCLECRLHGGPVLQRRRADNAAPLPPPLLTPHLPPPPPEASAWCGERLGFELRKATFRRQSTAAAAAATVAAEAAKVAQWRQRQEKEREGWAGGGWTS